MTGVELRVPLPVFDRKQAELLQLASRKEQAGYEQQSIALQIQHEVSEAIRAYETAKAEVEVYQNAQHGWCVMDMPNNIYSKPDAEKAWGKLVALYKTL